MKTIEEEKNFFTPNSSQTLNVNLVQFWTLNGIKRFIDYFSSIGFKENRSLCDVVIFFLVLRT